MKINLHYHPSSRDSISLLDVFQYLVTYNSKIIYVTVDQKLFRCYASQIFPFHGNVYHIDEKDSKETVIGHYGED